MMNCVLVARLGRPVAVCAVILALALPWCGGAFAQGAQPRDKQERSPVTPREKSPEKGDKGEKSQKGAVAQRPFKAPGSSIPDDPAKRALLLRDLYALLATATDQESANLVAGSIEHVWAAAAGDTVKVLMERAGKAASEDRPDLALRMLDTVTRIAPDYPDGFNRRAFIYYSINEYERALGDLRRVLALEPNHYKALEGLGQILRETGQKRAALGVYQKLISVHPFATGVKTVVEELEREVAGQAS